jgi:hypothetical protein
LFEEQRGAILGAQMMMICLGKVQRAGGAIPVIAELLIDQSAMLRCIDGVDEAFTVPGGRGRGEAWRR